MRIRTLLAGAATAAVVVLAPVGPAWAQSEDEPTDEHADEVTEEGGEHGAEGTEISHVGHCVEEAVAAGRDPAECQEAPNPILPEPVEIMWGTASFAVLLALMWTKGLPAIRKGMEGRTERIRSDLDRAETAKVEAEAVLVDYQAKLADARTEAARIIEEARQAADALKKDLAARAETDIAELRRRAAADVESARTQAVADLRSEVAALALDAAEMVVQKSLDRTTQIELIENYINQVGSRN
jgi:F-type H+-transporting ATPase subunit b